MNKLTKLSLALSFTVATGLLNAVAFADDTDVTISVGDATLYRLPLYVAMYEGFFKDEGLNATLLQANGGSDAIKMMVGGTAQFTSVPFVNVTNLHDQGIDTKFVSAISVRLNNSIVVRKELEGTVKTFADLKDRLIGTTAIGSGNWAAAVFLAKADGVDPDALKFVTLTDSNIVSAFRSGSVDALAHIDPYDYELVNSGDAFFLTDFADDATHKRLVGPEALFNGMIATNAYISEHPETVQMLANGLQHSLNWIREQSPDDLVALLKSKPEWSSFDDDVLKGILERVLIGLPETVQIDQAAYDGINKFNTAAGVQAAPIPIADTVDNTFADIAAQKYPAK